MCVTMIFFTVIYCLLPTKLYLGIYYYYSIIWCDNPRVLGSREFMIRMSTCVSSCIRFLWNCQSEHLIWTFFWNITIMAILLWESWQFTSCCSVNLDLHWQLLYYSCKCFIIKTKKALYFHIHTELNYYLFRHYLRVWVHTKALINIPGSLAWMYILFM